jgi:hypothetical protein
VKERKHFQEWTAEPQISPLRCAPVEMTKGRAVMARSGRSREGKQPICPGPPCFARGNKGQQRAFVQQLLSLEAWPFPLSSRPERSAVERSAVQRSLLEMCLLGDFQRNDHARLDAMACQGSLPQYRARGIRGVRRSHSGVRVCGSGGVRIATFHGAHLKPCVHH